MDNFDKAIRTSQVSGGGVYVEAQVAINSEIYTYGQHYGSDNPDSPTYCKDIPHAVERFKAFYGPMYLKDLEAAE